MACTCVLPASRPLQPRTFLTPVLGSVVFTISRLPDAVSLLVPMLRASALLLPADLTRLTNCSVVILTVPHRCLSVVQHNVSRHTAGVVAVMATCCDVPHARARLPPNADTKPTCSATVC